LLAKKLVNPGYGLLAWAERSISQKTYYCVFKTFYKVFKQPLLGALDSRIGICLASARPIRIDISVSLSASLQNKSQ
jgi:hypothetical protein